MPLMIPTKAGKILNIPCPVHGTLCTGMPRLIQPQPGRITWGPRTPLPNPNLASSSPPPPPPVSSGCGSRQSAELQRPPPRLPVVVSYGLFPGTTPQPLRFRVVCNDEPCHGPQASRSWGRRWAGHSIHLPPMIHRPPHHPHIPIAPPAPAGPRDNRSLGIPTSPAAADPSRITKSKHPQVRSANPGLTPPCHRPPDCVPRAGAPRKPPRACMDCISSMPHAGSFILADIWTGQKQSRDWRVRLPTLNGTLAAHARGLVRHSGIGIGIDIGNGIGLLCEQSVLCEKAVYMNVGQ